MLKMVLEIESDVEVQKLHWNMEMLYLFGKLVATEKLNTHPVKNLTSDYLHIISISGQSNNIATL